jgi:3-oxoacyl-[acyl-carrier-protein] synthase II
MSTSHSHDPIVVTGIGLITSIGQNKNDFLIGLQQMHNGISSIAGFDTTGFATTIAGEIKDYQPEEHFHDRKEIRRLAKFSQFAIIAAKEALLDAKMTINDDNARRVGVFVGSGMGALGVTEEQTLILKEKGPSRVSPFTVPLMIPNMASGNVSIAIGAKGPNICPISACATGADAIGVAMRSLMAGDADVMLAGGTEAVITPLGIAAFAAAKALSTHNTTPENASRPFDRNRDGFVMGEGAGVLVLEKLSHALARGVEPAQIYGVLAGYGQCGDAYHMTAPDPDGDGCIRAMKLAMADAGLTPQDIDYINAHGTSTPLNDKTEAKAIGTLFAGIDVSVSSTKSQIGHLLGAAGAVEAIATLLAIKHGFLPATRNLTEIDDDCVNLTHVSEVKPAIIRAALSNNMGFGGHNTSLLLTRYDG